MFLGVKHEMTGLLVLFPRETQSAKKPWLSILIKKSSVNIEFATINQVFFFFFEKFPLEKEKRGKGKKGREQ